MEERPLEKATDHRCILGVLTQRLAAADGPDRADIAADALVAMLGAGRFDDCCVPRYLELAPRENSREIQIPIATDGDVETRVIVWPVGSHDARHPHDDGWTVFVPVVGSLATFEESGGEASACGLAPREPVVLRPEQRLRHLVRNIGEQPALSVHVSGPV